MAKGCQASIILGGCAQGEVWKELAYALGTNFGMVSQVISICQALPTTVCRPPRAPHAPVPLHKHIPLLILLRYRPREPHPHTSSPCSCSVRPHRPTPTRRGGRHGFPTEQNDSRALRATLRADAYSKLRGCVDTASLCPCARRGMPEKREKRPGVAVTYRYPQEVAQSRPKGEALVVMYRDVVLFCGAPPHIGTRVAEKAGGL
ncbi:hypothetical protein DFH08DRAFT_892510 [Mycena albidolilacea]|uniref:Uncharacterized protein n=1 Tax=Mycena albidolilacea TaxID=1033008 RepID=A0AAD6ZDM0_9AGAR|nr:hypothetical protein DFH08DRAFT_892510 [Mycena albidolilacea]